jgi:predicted negative regulator of RcsB-dependent stress response
VRRWRLARLTAAAQLAAAFALAGQPAAAEESGPKGPTVVSDLAYGEVLFYFFQDDYLSALTRLLAGQERGEFSANRDDAEILLGGLYLSYGEHQLAGQIFERLLAQSVAPELHDRAWFFLAKIWYQRGYLKEAAAALARIQGELPREFASEYQMLRAQVLMDQGRFDEALALLEAWRRPDERWVGYAKYNIGVALVRLNRVADGAAVLDEVGQIEPKNEELAALRDKANVALGYAWLQAGQPLAAKPSLQRVRLAGPFSNKALLGVGWADAAQEDYQGALAPWLELRHRDLMDSAVQESLLAVPYAFAKLGASKQAADYYEDAVASFDAEVGRIDGSIKAMREGTPLKALLATRPDNASGWYFRLDELPDTIETRHLYELMATHRFQEGLKNYRDLQYLQKNLDRWHASLAVFDDILDTRQRAYEERLPVISKRLGGVDVDRLAERRVELESRLKTIERTNDYAALGTPREQGLWNKLSQMEPRLGMLAGRPGVADLAEKQRFLKGLLTWDLRRDYNARLWQEQRNLRDLDRQLKEMQRRYHQVDEARAEWPEKFATLTARIGALEPRVAALEQRMTDILARQERFVESIAIDELKAQRDRLDTYTLQARFALASLYDEAAAQANASPGDGAAP